MHILSVVFIWVVVLSGVRYFDIGRVPPGLPYFYIAVGAEGDQQCQLLACHGDERPAVAGLGDAFKQFPIVADVDPYAFAFGRGEDAERRDDVFFFGVETAGQAVNGLAAVVACKVDVGGCAAYFDGVVACFGAGGFRQSADGYMYRRGNGQHLHVEGGLWAGRRVVVDLGGSPEQVGGRVEVSRSGLCGRKRCEGDKCSVEGSARL